MERHAACARHLAALEGTASGQTPLACSLALPPAQGKIRSLEQIFLFSLPVKEYQVGGGRCSLMQRLAGVQATAALAALAVRGLPTILRDHYRACLSTQGAPHAHHAR